MSWPRSDNIKEVNGIHPENQDRQKILKNIQANILKSHGRDQAYHIFLRFKEDQNNDVIKAWIQDFAKKYITSAWKQYEDSQKRRKNPKYSGGLLGCFFLSYSGYQALGYKPKGKFDPSFEKGMKNGDQYRIDLEFGSGPESISNRDPKFESWEDHHYRNEVHAMLLLAQNWNEVHPSLEDIIQKIKNELKDIADIVTIEYGRRLINNKGQDIEHFGFRDGFSNPLFFHDEIFNYRSTNPQRKHDPSADLDLVLVRDPFTNKVHHKGSYFVFRKLKQDVKSFNGGVELLAREIFNIPKGPIDEVKLEWVYAQIVGRFKNGVPLTEYDDSLQIDEQTTDIIDFNYKEDNDGRKCPIAAHIRQVNVRLKGAQATRIVRRSIPYGRNSETEDVGLLFMCYQSSILKQFEFIQRFWVDSNNEPLEGSGQDPLIGQRKKDTIPQLWTTKHNSSNKKPFDFRPYVKLQGGEYFFAPSIYFLENIPNSL